MFSASVGAMDCASGCGSLRTGTGCLKHVVETGGAAKASLFVVVTQGEWVSQDRPGIPGTRFRRGSFVLTGHWAVAWTNELGFMLQFLSGLASEVP